MRNNTILTTMFLFLTLGVVLTACSSKTKATDTQPPAVQATATQAFAIQATATQAPAVQATATQAPTIQATATQPPAIQATATQPPAVQATATQPPANTATVAPLTPDGAVLLNDRCTICHSLDRVTSLKNSADQWTRIVSRMIQNGAQLTPAEQKILVNYLAKTYGP
jgi:mono/diheme cytochrome c family protein